MYSILLLGALTVISGLIAYIGDALGKKLGKKRLTLFRLRPRYTAMVISIMTGILIFVTTVVVLAIVSREVRIALFELDKLLRERESLHSQLAELRSSYHMWKKRAEALDSKLKEEQQKVIQAQRQHAQVSAELNAARAQLKDAKSRLHMLSDALYRLKDELLKSKRQLSATQLELGHAKDELKDTIVKLQNSREELEKLKAEIAKADETAKRSIATTRKQLDELRRQVDELQAMRAELEHYRRNLDTYIAQVLFRGDLAYRAEETVAVEVIDGSVEKERILTALNNLLDNADKLARQRGASAQAGERAIKIFGMLVKLPEQEEPVLFTERDILNIIADNISETKTSVIVEVYAKRNSLAGEQVPVDIRLYRNQLIFRQGEVLTSARVNGRASTGELMQQLANILHTNLNRIARERGLFVRMDGERPTYGAISFSEFGDAIEQLKRINGPAIVEAIAKMDTFTIGPLEVKLRVTPAG